MKNKTLFFILLMGVCWQTAAIAQPSRAVMEATQRAVVKVESGKKVGSGFLWKNRNWVVTTLHLLSTTGNISITTSDGIRKGKVVKVLRSFDLVLLELDKPVTNSVPVLTGINTNVAVNMLMYSVGYNGEGNLNSIIDRALRLGYNSNGTLEGLLPASIKKALSVCKRPDPTIPVLYLEGTLLPGFSGAPIIDQAGRLLGIADGGLERGASSISWGISAAKLANLERSSEGIGAIQDCGAANAVSFGSDIDLDDKSVKTIAFDDLLFVKTKTRTVLQMMRTVDDSAGLTQLLFGMYTNTNFDYNKFRYDIYEEISTGAVFCVPEGAGLQRHGDAIKADFFDGGFTFLSMIKANIPVADSMTKRYGAYIGRFQRKIMELDGGKLRYVMDPGMSYGMPYEYVDGFVNRIAFNGFRLDTTRTGQISQVSATYSFQTIIGRNDVFFGVAVLTHDNTLPAVQKVNGCLLANACKSANVPAGCATACKKMEWHSKLILGVHMSGLGRPYAL